MTRDDIEPAGRPTTDPQPWVWDGDGSAQRSANPWLEEPDGGYWIFHPRDLPPSKHAEVVRED